MNARLFPRRRSSSLLNVGVLWLAAVVACGLTACGTTERVADSQAAADAERHARVLFYREASAGLRAQVPINLYIGGHYRASLLGNGYTEQALCPGVHEFAAHYSDTSRLSAARAGKLRTQAFRIDAAPVQYFRLIEDAAGELRMVAVAPETAARIVHGLHLQTQTLSRVVRKDCPAH